MAEKRSLRIGVDTLFESPALGTGGLVYLRNIVGALGEVANREKLFLFTSKKNVKFFRGLAPNLSLIPSGWSNERPLLRIFSQQVIIPLLVEKLKLDVLLCPGNVIPVAGRIPRVLVVQNRMQYDLPVEYGTIRSFYRKTLGKLSLAGATRVIVPSQDLKQYLEEALQVAETSIAVVPEGVDPNLFVYHAGHPALKLFDSPYFLTVGTLWPYKNHEIIIRAFARCFHEHGLAGKLLVVGGGWKGRKQELSYLAGQLGIGEMVIFVGHVPHERMPSIYAGAGALLYPSLVESFGLPVIEAMACGVPVITSNRCSLPEVVGDAGICLDPDDERGWAESMYKTMTDQNLRSCLVERGLNRSRQYTWRAAGQKIHEILHAVAQQNGTG